LQPLAQGQGGYSLPALPATGQAAFGQQFPRPFQPGAVQAPLHPEDPLAPLRAVAGAQAAGNAGAVVKEESDLPVVWVCRPEIQQVLTNLVTNAVSYSPPGAEVEVRTDRREFQGQPYITAQVHNGGPPISAEDLPHIFERFYRGRNAHLGGEPGTGLGLAICKEIVERHQGWIEAESVEGRGSTFTVWLPLRPRGGS